MISCTDWAGECAMSSAVMTAVDAPTMPANCRFVVTLFVCPLLGGELLGLLVCETFGAARREPDPSSCAGPGLIHGQADLDRRQLIRSGLLRAGGGNP